MEEREHDTQLVKRVVLPSGKTIEVVLFGEADLAEHARTQAHAEPDQDLHLCAGCESQLV